MLETNLPYAGQDKRRNGGEQDPKTSAVTSHLLGRANPCKCCISKRDVKPQLLLLALSLHPHGCVQPEHVHMVLTRRQLLHQKEGGLETCQHLSPMQVLHQPKIVLQRFTVVPQACYQH